LIIVDGVDYARAKTALLHCTALCDFADARILTHLPSDDHFRHQIKPIESIYDYSEFVIKELANYFATAHVLLAQWDGFVWQTGMWSDEFLVYDYIGAPWPDKFLVKGIPRHFNVGNGGFSLRSRRLQEFLRDDPNIIVHKVEDVAICQLNRAYLEVKGFTFAPVEVARRFSWELLDQQPAFGAHGRLRLK
jgi:hypothetical protein